MTKRELEWEKVSKCLKKDVAKILQQGEGPVHLHKFYNDLYGYKRLVNEFRDVIKSDYRHLIRARLEQLATNVDEKMWLIKPCYHM